MITDDTIPDLLRAAADPGQTIQALEREFPGTEIWHGTHTKHYLALADGHLLKAPTALSLYQQLRERRPAQ